MNVPWAGKHSRFTLFFEAFAIEVLQACGNVQAACKLLNLDWSAADTIMKRAVQRGLTRRDTDQVTRVGIDEKSFGKGHDYVSLMTDIDGRRIQEVFQGRDREAAACLWKTLSADQRSHVKAIAMDMWRAFESAAKANPAQADCHWALQNGSSALLVQPLTLFLAWLVFPLRRMNNSCL